MKFSKTLRSTERNSWAFTQNKINVKRLVCFELRYFIGLFQKSVFSSAPIVLLWAEFWTYVIRIKNYPINEL